MRFNDHFVVDRPAETAEQAEAFLDGEGKLGYELAQAIPLEGGKIRYIFVKET